MPLSLTLLLIAMGLGVLPWPGPPLDFAEASESPERECCDPVYPLLTPTASTAVNPTGLLPTVPGPPSKCPLRFLFRFFFESYSFSFSGPNVKNTVAILNCLLARQLCQEDVSCSAILQIIPRVCGLEQGKIWLSRPPRKSGKFVPANRFSFLVACSTVTVTKCQAALRTLQGFPFFRPTCLCREPSVDPECNQFRDSLFDHPCIFVLKKG